MFGGQKSRSVLPVLQEYESIGWVSVSSCGDVLRTFRRRKRISRRALAGKLGVHPNTIMTFVGDIDG